MFVLILYFSCMREYLFFQFAVSALLSFSFINQTIAQITNSVFIQNIVVEVVNNSQLKYSIHELLDVFVPRLVGKPQMKQASDWAIAKYKSWGIDAKTEN